MRFCAMDLSENMIAEMRELDSDFMVLVDRLPRRHMPTWDALRAAMPAWDELEARWNRSANRF